MARVFSMHEIELLPGASADAFERFVRDESARMPFPPGMTASVLKGDRVERVGRYLFLVEFDSEETRARLYPEPRTPSEEMRQLLAAPAVQGFLGRWGTMATIPDQGTVYTDYVVVAPEA